MKISLTPNCCAFGRTWSSSSPCPMSAVKVTTSASYVSCSHLRMTEVSRPPEYASAILRREELCLLMVVRQTESRAGLWMGEFEARDYRARSEEHTSELQSLMRTSYAVFCLKKKKEIKHITQRKKEVKKRQKIKQN